MAARGGAGALSQALEMRKQALSGPARGAWICGAHRPYANVADQAMREQLVCLYQRDGARRTG